jgi:hypothetical protein
MTRCWQLRRCVLHICKRNIFLLTGQFLHTAQSGVVFHLVKLRLGTSPKGIPLTQLEQLGRVSRVLDVAVSQDSSVTHDCYTPAPYIN